ncbi:MAG: hypothetical protein JXR76_03380 [Deltaproteobacteria bacterium]|nr:hypothetical protein [Deltaproteobacteria bacterium]
MSKKNYQDCFRVFSERQGVSVQEHEQIFETVYKKTSQAESPYGVNRVRLTTFSRWAVPVLAGCLIVAAALWFEFPYGSSHSNRDVTDEYTAKGNSSGPLVMFQCADRTTPHTCHRNDTMIFKVLPPKAQPYFASFARHVKSNSVVWYYPSNEKEKSEFIDDTNSVTAFREGIYIGDEHVAGDYELISIFSDHPLALDDIRQLFEAERKITQNEMTVVKSAMTVAGQKIE